MVTKLYRVGFHSPSPYTLALRHGYSTHVGSPGLGPGRRSAMITDSQGDALTRGELLRRIGRLEQVAGIEPFVFDDGPSRGVRAFRFRTSSGLSFDVLADRGMDLGFAEQGPENGPQQQGSDHDLLRRVREL